MLQNKASFSQCIGNLEHFSLADHDTWQHIWHLSMYQSNIITNTKYFKPNKHFYEAKQTMYELKIQRWKCEFTIKNYA